MHFWVFYSYLGGPGGPLRQTQGYQIFRAVRSHYRADTFIAREQNNDQFFIYGPQCEKIRILGYSGGPGWPINNPTGPILLPRHPLTYINLHIKIWKQSDKDFCENDEVSADAAADADAAEERRLNHSIPRTYFVRGIQL